MIVAKASHFYKNPFHKHALLWVLLFLFTACTAPAPARSIPALGLREQAAKTGTAFTVIYHPDGPLYVGDQVSIEVLSPPNFTASNQNIRVSLNDPSTGTEKALGETSFGQFGIGGRQQATFYWVWDTKGLKADTYTLSFSVLPAGSAWTKRVTLHPAADVPYPEPNARWVTVESACCAIHYISGTDAERDIEKLKAAADAEAADVERRLRAKFTEKIPLTFLPRVLGQGGFASNGIYVSYLDANYAGSTTSQVVHHEMVHWLDVQMGASARIPILQEGLAVHFSDGHFKKEPITIRAAALLQMKRYIPLRELTDAFYSSQHEIGYIEAGALMGYLIETYGWEKFNTFFRNIKPVGGADSAVFEAGLQAHFDLSLNDLETNFLAYLRQQTVSANDLTDVHLTISFYDAVRRYQQVLDPSAYFMTAWLPDGNDVRERGIVADYLRHPVTPTTRQIEGFLVAGDASLRAGDYKMTELYIRLVNTLLDAVMKAQKK